MAVSLELRTPFLDYRMVEFAARLPSRLRVGLDATGRYRTKLILRRFAASRLPAEIVERPKQGFPVPRSEEHTSEIQSIMRISYAVLCLKNKNITTTQQLNKS